MQYGAFLMAFSCFALGARSAIGLVGGGLDLVGVAPRKGGWGSGLYRHGQLWAFGDGGQLQQWRSQKFVKGAGGS